jgi:asparagine synthase (glutamine-hydrolysing)
VASPLDEVGADLRAMLGRAIARRLRGDQPVGVMLSGGLDSTSVAAVATTLADVTGYTAALPEHPEIDESQLVATLARGVPLSVASAEVRSPSAFPTALEYLADWELPLTGPGALFEHPLAELAARDGVGLLIDGQGGDELFGRSEYLIADAVRAGRPRRVLDLARGLAGGVGRPRRDLGAIVLHWGVKPALPHGVHRLVRRIRPPRRYGAAWLSDDASRAVARTEDPWDWKRPRGVPRWWAGQLDRMTGLRERFGVQEYVRHRGASAGVRSRSPLLDPDLVERMLAVAPELAFRSALGRPVLREAVRGLSPDAVRLRDGKADLSAFLHPSVTGAGSDAIARLLREPDARVLRYVRRDALERILDRTRAVERGSLPLAIALWRIGNIELWLRLQEDTAFPQRFLGAAGIPRSEFQITRSERR